MLCNRNEMIDIFSYGATFSLACCTMVQALPICIWIQHLVLMAGQLSMMQYQFQIIDHGFLQTHKNIKRKNFIYVAKSNTCINDERITRPYGILS